MYINNTTIVPAKLLTKEKKYYLLCYFAFDDIREIQIKKDFFDKIKKSDYYFVSIEIKNGKQKINVVPADEYEFLIKEKYEIT